MQPDYSDVGLTRRVSRRRWFSRSEMPLQISSINISHDAGLQCIPYTGKTFLSSGIELIQHALNYVTPAPGLSQCN